MSISVNTSKLKSGFSKPHPIMYSVNMGMEQPTYSYLLYAYNTPYNNRIISNIGLSETFILLKNVIYPQLKHDYYNSHNHITHSIKSNLLKNITQ